MINYNKEKLQSLKNQFDKNFNIALNRIENTKALELLNDDVIKKMDEAITPIYEMAKKLKKLLRKIILITDVFSEIGKLNQFKAMLDTTKKESPNLSI